MESDALLVGDDLVSVSPGTDCVCSPVEYEPLLVVSWCVVSDSQSVLVTTNVFMPEDSSVMSHLGLELEPDSVIESLFRVLDAVSVEHEELTRLCGACREDKPVPVLVCLTLEHDALLSVVDQLSASELKLLEVLVCPGSHDHYAVMEAAASLVAKRKLPLVEDSHGSGPSVEGEPLSVIPRLVVPDSHVELSSSNVSVPVKRSLAWHL
jgi:hypothetical protein